MAGKMKGIQRKVQGFERNIKGVSLKQTQYKQKITQNERNHERNWQEPSKEVRVHQKHQETTMINV